MKKRYKYGLEREAMYLTISAITAIAIISHKRHNLYW